MTKPFANVEEIEVSGDGSHNGLDDWYPRLEEKIVAALAKGAEHEWTVGWYASKKSIAWAQLSYYRENGIHVEVRVTNDFDTPGYASGDLPWTDDIDKIKDKINEVWEEAEEDKEGNEQFIMYKVMTERQTYGCYINGKPHGEAIMAKCWVETYLKAKVADNDLFFGDVPDVPPGDFYHNWGWQELDSEIPSYVRQKLAEWAEENDEGEFTCHGYTIKVAD